MKHELDNDIELLNHDGSPFSENQRFGFFTGLAEHIAKQYQRDREHQYPKLGEQLDMLWHEINSNGSISANGDWFNAIKEVKDAHPKP